MSERTWNPGDPDVLPEVDDPRRFGGRVDGSAREAVQQAAAAPWLDHYLDANLDACLDVPLSPDCAAGKCTACTGGSWNTAEDMPADCPHPCHVLAAPASAVGDVDPGW